MVNIQRTLILNALKKPNWIISGWAFLCFGKTYYCFCAIIIVAIKNRYGNNKKSRFNSLDRHSNLSVLMSSILITLCTSIIADCISRLVEEGVTMEKVKYLITFGALLIVAVLVIKSTNIN